jgi:hypothetical protein
MSTENRAASALFWSCADAISSYDVRVVVSFLVSFNVGGGRIVWWITSDIGLRWILYYRMIGAYCDQDFVLSLRRDRIEDSRYSRT